MIGFRHGAVLAGIALYAVLLNHGGQVPSVTLVIPLFWAAGLIFGARWKLIIWFICLSKKPAPSGPCWRYGLWGMILCTLGSAMALGERDLIYFLARSGPPVAITYAIAKIGCWRLGCCDWKQTEGFPRRIPLPLVEAGLSSLFTIMLLLVAAFGLHSPWQCALAFSSHGSLRWLNRLGRGA